MSKSPTYQVQELARLVGVSVRTLHHYDEIGLLRPSQRSAAGYRLYDLQDLLRLQQVMIGRELGLPLEEIRRALDEPGFDHVAALQAQRAALQACVARTERMVRAIDRALASLGTKERETMDEGTLFDGFVPERYAREAEQRWGQSEAYRESAKRTQRYGEAEWTQIRQAQEASYRRAAALLEAQEPADGEHALEVAEQLRLQIDRWFYPCSHAMHDRLAALYEQDARFAANIDRYAPGLTAYLVQAIRANGARFATEPGDAMR